MPPIWAEIGPKTALLEVVVDRMTHICVISDPYITKREFTNYVHRNLNPYRYES